MLKGKNLCFRYRKDLPWVVQGFSIEVERGEIVGLSGPSGFGKTTLGKLLAGYLQPNAGSVTVDGKPLPVRGYCPVQLIFQLPELAIAPRWRIAKVLNEGQSLAPELLQTLNIDTSWLNRWSHELSGGELQRVAVARALGSRTRYLIADEMTTMLDANTQALIWSAVINYAKQTELGILAISHDAALLQRLCHRIVNLAIK
jgi:peptide/nickel transport system ATP-binding protein/Fe3+-transporting ATPase